MNSIYDCQTTPSKASKNYMQLYKLTEVHNQPNSIKHNFQISAKEHKQLKAWKLLNSSCPYSSNTCLYTHIYLSHEAFYFFSETCSLSFSPVFPHSSYLYSDLYIEILLPDNRIGNQNVPELMMQSSSFLICTSESIRSELKLP